MQFGTPWNIISRQLIKYFLAPNHNGLLKYDDKSLEISPHLFKRVAVAGICGAD
jgi:hypothetical protein